MLKRYLIVVVLIACTGVFAAQWGSLSGPLPGVKMSGPKHVSRYFVTEVNIVNGQGTVQIPIDSPQGALMMLTGLESDAVTIDGGKNLTSKRYRTPDLQSMDIPEVGTRVELGSVTAGRHSLVFKGKHAEGPVQLIVAQPESPLSLEVRTHPLSVHVGDPVTVEARFSESVDSASIRAFIENGEEISLHDDGVSGDRVANDGIYTGLFTAAEKRAGGVSVRVEADGRLTDGVPFRRTAPAAVMISQPCTGINGRVIDGAMSVNVPLKAATGRFRVDVIYGSGSRAVAWARQSIRMDGSASDVTVIRPRPALDADCAIVRILNLDTLGLEEERRVSLTSYSVPTDPVGKRDRINMAVTSRQKASLPVSKMRSALVYGDGSDSK